MLSACHKGIIVARIVSAPIVSMVIVDSPKMAQIDQQERYVRVKLLGRGAFGEAVLYRKSESSDLVVWKEIPLAGLNQRRKEEVQNEIEILGMFSHANIVAYYNHFIGDDALYIEMEYANGGSLYHKIVAQEDTLFAEDTVLWYFYQIALALEYIHSKNILHRDLKTLNVFLTKAGLAKLGDFGMSKLLENDEKMAQTVVGTPYYMSPELIKGLQYDTKSDIWALGCILHELLTLEKTFQASNTLKLAAIIARGTYAQIDSCYSNEIAQLVHMCLKQEPAERASIEQLLDAEIIKQNQNTFDAQLNQLGAPFNRQTSSKSDFSIPVVTAACSELYLWGGGKLSAQKQDDFCSQASGARTISIGGAHIAVVSYENELYTWITGNCEENCGQLGHGSKAAYKKPKIVNFFEGVPVSSVACGYDFTICLTGAGSVYSFGSNYYGCLGLGQKVQNALTPTQIENLPKTTQIASGDHHVLALSQDESVYSWGRGEYGCLGSGSEEDIFEPSLVPLPKVSQISLLVCGPTSSFLLTTAGRLLAAGSNEQNKLGLNAQIAGVTRSGQNFCYDVPVQNKFKVVKALAHLGITAVAAGVDHSAVVDRSGHVYSFGNNDSGQLGLSDYKPRLKCSRVAGPLAGKIATRVACGDRYTVVTTADNQVFSWGFGENGRLGVEVSLSASRGFVATAIPRPIFGALYGTTALTCRGSLTAMVAELVTGEKSIRSVASFHSDKNEEMQDRPKLTDELPSFGDAPTIPVDSSSVNMPPWLQNEIDAAEVIPLLDSATNLAQSDRSKMPTDQSIIIEQSELEMLREENAKLKAQLEECKEKLSKLETKLVTCSCQNYDAMQEFDV